MHRPRYFGPPGMLNELTSVAVIVSYFICDISVHIVTLFMYMNLCHKAVIGNQS